MHSDSDKSTCRVKCSGVIQMHCHNSRMCDCACSDNGHESVRRHGLRHPTCSPTETWHNRAWPWSRRCTQAVRQVCQASIWPPHWTVADIRRRHCPKRLSCPLFIVNLLCSLYILLRMLNNKEFILKISYFVRLCQVKTSIVVCYQLKLRIISVNVFIIIHFYELRHCRWWKSGCHKLNRQACTFEAKRGILMISSTVAVLSRLLFKLLYKICDFYIVDEDI